MLPTVYGYADGRDVETLIRARMDSTSADDIAGVVSLLGEAVRALLEINEVIPVHAKQRHMVATALENFAEGK